MHWSTRIAFASAAATISMCLAAAADDPANWKLAFTNNPKLPPVFRQAEIPRPDGSRLTCFVGNFDNSMKDRKPLLVYVEGSGAQSQFVKAGDKIGYGVFGLIAQRAGKNYQVATTEKRGVEFAESTARGSGQNASAEYTTHACLSDRVADVRLLLDALLAEPLIDPARVVLLGHSEGADIVAAVAAEDPRVTHVAFLSGGGAAQLFDFYIMRRKALAESKASPEDTEKAIAELDDDIRKIAADPQSETKFFLGHAYKRWSTMATVAAADNLVKTKARLFVAHGSADQSVPIESFDYLVLQIILHGRNDAVVHRYPGRDHSYIPTGAQPSSAPFLEVVDQVLNWAESGGPAAAGP